MGFSGSLEKEHRNPPSGQKEGKSTLARKLRGATVLAVGTLALSTFAPAQQTNLELIARKDSNDVISYSTDKTDSDGIKIRELSHFKIHKSTNWVGFMAGSTSKHNIEGVTAKWTVPDLSTAQKETAVASWIGIGNRPSELPDVVDKSLIQLGIVAYMKNGVPSYEAWFQLLPMDSQMRRIEMGSLQPGDELIGGIVKEGKGNGKWSLVIRNERTGRTENTRISYDVSTNAIWAIEAPEVNGKEMVLPAELGLSMQGCMAKVNGKYVSLADEPIEKLVIGDQSNGGIKYTVSVVKSGLSSGFSVMTNKPISVEENAPVNGSEVSGLRK